MVSIIHIQQGQGIRHALLLGPMLLLGASQHGEAQNFIGYYELLVHALLLLHLVKHVKQLIKSTQQHLGLVSIMQHILVVQGAPLCGGGLEHGDACIPSP